MNESIRTLHNDKRGAIMLMGLCMSCFLIGSLWFLIGVGDAIVFRDTMQEATDHATFTSAALHAKGMNFISACNLLLLALIAVHIIMGIIHDILLAICIIGAIFTLGSACTPWLNFRNIYSNYGKIFKPIAGAIHLAEVGAAYAYPLLGAYKGYTTGKDYQEYGPKKHDMNMLVLSPSLIPGTLLTSALNKAFFEKPGIGPTKPGTKPPAPNTSGNSDQSGAKKGLPVEAKKFSAVCELIGSKGLNALFSATGQSNGKAIDMVKGWLKGLLKFRYCNDLGKSTPDIAGHIADGNSAIDAENQANAGKKGNTPLEKVPVGTGSGTGQSGSGGGLAECMKDGSTIDPGLDKWWGCDGPLVPWSGTLNGSPWNQVWGVNLYPEFSDAQEHRVALGQRKLGMTSTAENQLYFTEAEFYFDCADMWTTETCNKEDNAGYSVQWRARLKRLEFPEVGSLLSSFAGQFITKLGGYKALSDKLKKIGKSGVGAGSTPTSPLGSFIDQGVDKLFKTYVTPAITGNLNKLGKLLDPELGAYH